MLRAAKLKTSIEKLKSLTKEGATDTEKRDLEVWDYCEKMLTNLQNKMAISNDKLKKHGVEYSMQMPSTLKKAKETIKERYGDEHYFAFGEGWKKAIIEKYGSKQIMYELIKNKTEQTCLKKYGVGHIAQA